MTVSQRGYVPAFTNLIQDPYVVAELDRIAAWAKSLQSSQANDDAEKGLDNHTTITPEGKENPDETTVVEDGVRWLRGPWLLNADGANPGPPGSAAIAPPQIEAAQVDNYGPEGIDKAIMLELSSDQNVTITGIKVATQQRRLLGIFNRGGFTISFENQSADSIAAHRFSWGTTGDSGDLIVVPTGQIIWFYYAAQVQRWKLFAIPPVGSENLPPTLVPEEIDPVEAVDFPFLNYLWFGARINGDSATPVAIGEGAIGSIGGSFYSDPLYGVGRAQTTGAVAGNGAGPQSAGSAQISPEHDPARVVLIRTGADVTSVRIWCLLTNAAISDSDDQPGGGGSQFIGFRFSTAAGDTGWRGAVRDGSNINLTSNIGTVAADTVYRLKFRKVGGTVYFSVNGSAEVSLAANLPADGTQMFWNDRIITQTNDARTLRWFWHFVRGGHIAP